MSIREALSQWLNDQIDFLKAQSRFTWKELVVVCFLAVAMAGAGVIINRQARIVKVEQTRPSKKLSASKSKKPKPIVKPPIYVHVGGSVNQPGLLKLQADARTAEAIQLAGGVSEEGDIDGVNLAARLQDGQKIIVPSKTQPFDATITDQNNQNSALININTADSDKLQELDGVGPVLASRIIDWRQKHGVFKSIRQIDSVKGIGPSKYESIKDTITVD